ncbi:host specificity factor TipJ family phage tail protein [Zobellella sp. DQSA1]|uniref:host specificity factor TipJ family phage tail protein n=1 Tax=Zobellella sp. DQSA1 TaxID=3342386 RepID=UPI0035C24DB4
MIEIYPSTLPGEPLERHQVQGITLHDWLTEHVREYRLGPEQPISATVGGQLVPPEQWDQLMITAAAPVQLRVQPKDAVTAIFAAVGAIAGMFLSQSMAKKPQLTQNQGTQGEKMAGTAVGANIAKTGEIVPELAGRHRRYPDYLCQPRKYFVDPRTQAVDMMLCVGPGRYLLPDSQIKIGETPTSVLGEKWQHSFFEPGADVSGHQSHRNWYNAPEVGASTGSSGLRLTAGSTVTRHAQASRYVISGNAIIIPPSAGSAPQDWESGGIVTITDNTRTIEIVDGGGHWSSPNRDLVRGNFADLGLAVGDELVIRGLLSMLIPLRVHSITTTVDEPGSASTITGVRVAPLEYELGPITFAVGVSTVTLDDDYATHDALVTALNGQLAGVLASHSGGVIAFTELTPFAGQPLPLSGYYDPLLGASPARHTGAETRSYSEMELDIRHIVNGVSEWRPASTLPAGTHHHVGISRAAVAVPGRDIDVWSTRYRIAGLITQGELIIGWEFQRLRADGTDDPGWSGFPTELETSHVSIEHDQSQVAGGWLGPFLACPEAETTALIEWDIFAPGGHGWISDDGTVIPFGTRRVIELQYRDYHSSGAWISVTRTIDWASRDQLGGTFSQALPAAITPEVRMRRIVAENDSTQAMDRLEWYGLKSLLPGASSYADVTTMAVTLIGSDVIAEQTENQISLIATRILPVRAGGAWQPPQPTRDIVPWVSYIAKSMGHTDAELDLAELDRLGAIWQTRGDTFDHIITSPSTMRDSINQALMPGFAELTIDQGRIRPVRDEPRTEFEHMYSTQNMTVELKREFSVPKPDDHDGVDVEYLDPSTWTTETVECRLPGDEGRKVEKIVADGVLSRTRAWRIGMRRRRELKYRRWRYSWSTELDALNSRFMSYCGLGAEVPGRCQSGWIRAVSDAGDGIARLSVSEPLQWENSEHLLSWRRPDGTLAGPYQAIRGADDFEVLVDMPQPWPDPAARQESPHFLFGQPYPALVRLISPQGMEQVQVQAVNYHPLVYADDNGSPPV